LVFDQRRQRFRAFSGNNASRFSPVIASFLPSTVSSETVPWRRPVRPAVVISVTGLSVRGAASRKQLVERPQTEA